MRLDIRDKKISGQKGIHRCNVSFLFGSSFCTETVSLHGYSFPSIPNEQKLSFDRAARTLQKKRGSRCPVRRFADIRWDWTRPSFSVLLPVFSYYIGIIISEILRKASMQIYSVSSSSGAGLHAWPKFTSLNSEVSPVICFRRRISSLSIPRCFEIHSSDRPSS